MSKEPTKLPISLVIICHNSADKVIKVIEYHRPYVSEVVVVDQGSTDDSYTKLKPFTDLITKRRCKGYSDPDRQWAYSLGTQPFILALDDDEFLQQDCLDNLENLLQSGSDAIWFKRNNLVDGISITEAFGEDPQCRLWKQGALKWPDQMHTYPSCANGVKTLFSDFWIDHIRTLEGLKKSNYSRNNVANPEIKRMQDEFILRCERFLSDKKVKNVG